MSAEPSAEGRNAKLAIVAAELRADAKELSQRLKDRSIKRDNVQNSRLALSISTKAALLEAAVAIQDIGAPPADGRG